MKKEIKKYLIIGIFILGIIIGIFIINNDVEKNYLECSIGGEPINSPELIGETDYNDECCEGFTGVRNYGIDKNGKCEFLIGSPYLWCVPCGNGVCDKFESIEENKCNCPEDCE